MPRLAVVRALVMGSCLGAVSVATAKDTTENTKGVTADPQATWDDASTGQRMSLTEEHTKTIAEVVETVNAAVADAEHQARAKGTPDTEAHLRCVRNKLASLTALQKASTMAADRLQASFVSAPDAARSEFVRVSMAADAALDISIETEVCSNLKALPTTTSKDGAKD